MDYKKEYEAMVQRARELHKGGNALTKKQMEIVCPELAESEDERIRKELIGFLWDIANGTNRSMPCAATCQEWIAYLEKQKEQKTLSTEETELNSLAFLEQMGYTCIPPGKEQKPAEQSESEKSHQWKPSEEQMGALNEAINTLAASKHPHENDYLFNVLNGLRENLKKL